MNGQQVVDLVGDQVHHAFLAVVGMQIAFAALTVAVVGAGRALRVPAPILVLALGLATVLIVQAAI